MFRKVGFWLVLALLLVAAGGGYFYFTSNNAQAQATEEPELQTAVVRPGSIVISASGSGSVVPASQIEVGFDSSGRLSELFVEVNDQVKAGDVLASLESTESDTALALKVSSAELAVLKAQQALDDLTAPSDTSLDVAQAQVELSQARLDLLNARENLAELTETRLGMNGTRCIAETIADLQDAYDLAVERYNRNSNDAALKALNTALANLNYCSSTYTEEEIATVEAEMALSQSEIDNLGARIIDLEAQIAELEDTTPDPAEVALAEAELKNAQLQLESAQEAMQTQYLVAPMDGTVMAVDANVGEVIGSSPFISLYDLSLPMLEVYVDETDLNQIGVGYEIEVVFDALPEQTFSGHIVSIDPSLQRVDNVNVVKALGQLDESSFSKPQTLPVGLNASVDVIGGKAENVLLVPVEALRELEEGSYAVFKMVNGQPRLTVVEVGLMDFTYAEIKSGLQSGDVVTTGIVETGE